MQYKSILHSQISDICTSAISKYLNMHECNIKISKYARVQYLHTKVVFLTDKELLYVHWFILWPFLCRGIINKSTQRDAFLISQASWLGIPVQPPEVECFVQIDASAGIRFFLDGTYAEKYPWGWVGLKEYSKKYHGTFWPSNRG